MAVHSPARKLAYEDYLRMPEDGQRHEILDGVHHVTATPFCPHQRASSQLHIRIGSFVELHGLGVLLAAPMGVVLSEHDIVEPDLLFISMARQAIATDRYIHGAPDLVIEILSPSTRRRDLGLKRARYERLGVAEYWVVDSERRLIAVYRRGESVEEKSVSFLPPQHLSAESEDRLATPLLPGLAIPLREIFVR